MAASEAIIAALQIIFPKDQIDLSGKSLTLNQSDVFFTAIAPPVAIVFPTALTQIQDLIKSAGEIGYSIAPKGAGLSYSDGYIPNNQHTVIVDMCMLNSIIEINERDRYVTVQPGVTWEQLHDALAKTGLRTPFWGTFSGKYATIGGAVSQGAKFFGSGNHGSVAESVLSLEVVIGDGSLVTTGSAATPHNPSPFYRYYGPDLTGLFLGDCGAYGIKTQITLQLIPAPQGINTASFSFQSAADMIAAMTEIGAQILVIPLVDNSSPSNANEFSQVVHFYTRMSNLLLTNDLKIAFETGLGPQAFADFLGNFDGESFGVNYDIGNSASFGFNPREEFAAVGPRILNVHVKDRVLGGTTVPLGSGNADFPTVFQCLNEHEYVGNLIMQTARALDGNHAEVLGMYREQIARWMEEAK